MESTAKRTVLEFLLSKTSWISPNPDAGQSSFHFCTCPVSILTGQVQKWKELYPASGLGDIQLVFDNKNSSTVRFAVDSICKGAPLSDKDVKALKTNQQVIDYVAHTPDAIGVIGVNWLGNRSM